jgi:uncharacterized RDD family membrane protein YckC
MTTDAPADSLEYAGFWARVGAALIDTVVFVCVSVPLLVAIYGWVYFRHAVSGESAGTADVLISWVGPAAFSIAFWLYKQATPGKLAVGARVVDAKTGGPITPVQSVVRYLGYFVSIIPLCLGLLWVAFDPRKQGWHDKLAGTVVVRSKGGGTQPVRFERP